MYRTLFENDVDAAQQKTTSRIAGRIVQHYEDQQPGQYVDEEVQFCIGLDCQGRLPRQSSANRRDNSARVVIPEVDGTFVTQDGRRALLEVDDELQKSASHTQAHINAINAMIRNCQQQTNPQQRQQCLTQLRQRVQETRSVFVEVAPTQGRRPTTNSAQAQVRAITTVDYNLNPVTGQLQTRSITRPTRNLTVQQMLDRNLLRGGVQRTSAPPPPRGSQRSPQRQPAPLSRRSSQLGQRSSPGARTTASSRVAQRQASTAGGRSPQQPRRNLRNRFDDFAAFY